MMITTSEVHLAAGPNVSRAGDTRPLEPSERARVAVTVDEGGRERDTLTV